ncbi:hypothetical protein VTN00DRAFT_10453 [Thermoascus crustaceus]
MAHYMPVQQSTPSRDTEQQ